MKGALSVSEWVARNGTETTGGMDWGRVERVIFIDSTWMQTKKIVKVLIIYIYTLTARELWLFILWCYSVGC